MMKTICYGFLNLLSLLFFCDLFLIILFGIGAVGFGIPSSQDECDAQVWLFVLGIASTMNVICLLFAIPSFVNNVEVSCLQNRVHWFFMVFFCIWLSVGIFSFDEKQQECTQDVLLAYKSIKLLTYGLYAVLFFIQLIGDCSKCYYQKEGRSVLEEPLVPPDVV